jgi:hypothetical protein
MAQEIINIGSSANDGTGDTLRAAMSKCNNNFTALFGGGLLESYTVATLPSTPVTGSLIFVSDGDTGLPCLAVYDGSNWKIISLGSNI